MTQKYKMTVGLEVHIELSTKSKIFCSCPTEFGAEPNSQICPICMGLPGAMPSLNQKVVEYAIRAGLATNCHIAKRSGIDRKNYFYPDLPKGYQISQYDAPLCYGGHIDLVGENGEERIGITRIHIEEDAGKLIHDKSEGTLVDYNRCGRPLIEIVSEPHIHSAETAREYLKKLRSLMVAAGVSDCKMNEGSMRCDVNLSVAPIGSDVLGERTEIKNLNSFAFVVKAIEYEYQRQCQMLEQGERVKRETLRYNTQSGKCEVMRSKESAIDYRFFPEPDLHVIVLEDSDIDKIKEQMPMLPDEKQRKYESELGLSAYDASLIAADPALSDYFEKAAEYTAYKKQLANILLCEVLRLVEGEDFECAILPRYLGELCEIFGSERVNSSTAKRILALMWEGDTASPSEIAEREGMWQINDESQLLEIVLAVIEKNQKAVADYKGGKSFAIRSIIGKTMAESQGRANPRIVEELILKEIEKK